MAVPSTVSIAAAANATVDPGVESTRITRDYTGYFGVVSLSDTVSDPPSPSVTFVPYCRSDSR